MSRIVLDFEPADKNIIKELGVFIDGKVQGYSFRPREKYKLIKQTFWCTKNLHEIVWISGHLDYTELSNILHRAVIVECSSKRTEQCEVFGKLLDEEVGKLEDLGYPKVQELVDEKICICSSYPFRHKTTIHSAERKAKLFGNWIMRHLML